jgi:hypothetical protein
MAVPQKAGMSNNADISNYKVRNLTTNKQHNGISKLKFGVASHA